MTNSQVLRTRCNAATQQMRLSCDQQTEITALEGALAASVEKVNVDYLDNRLIKATTTYHR